MIGYRISRADLEKMVGADWLKKASDRTNQFRRNGRYEESSSIWSEVKPKYMELQHQKCAFCERKLESIDLGAIEQDVEHFRPKASVKAWKAPKDILDQ